MGHVGLESTVNETDSEGNKWHHYNVFHKKLEKYLEINGFDLEKFKERNMHGIKPSTDWAILSQARRMWKLGVLHDEKCYSSAGY